MKRVARLVNQHIHSDFVERRPKRIILLRHGESLGNLDETIHKFVPDSILPLSKLGREQSRESGAKLKQLVGDESCRAYVSPYRRTRETFEIVSEFFDDGQMVFKEDSRLREQDFGNFQRNQAQTRRQRNLFGRFWYRMPEGESTSDTYDRVCGLYQSIMIHDSLEESGELGKAVDNYVMVAHGLSLRLLLMRILGWNVRRFNEVYNLDNGEIVILLKGSRGQYHLHSKLHEAKVKITEEETFKQFIQDYWTHCAEIGVAPPDGLTRNDVEELNAARDEMRTRGKL